MSKDKNLDDLFRERLRNYEQAPPAYLLENILDKVADHRKRRMLIFWRVAGVAAAILLAFIAGWQVNRMAVESPMVQVAAEKTVVPTTEVLPQTILNKTTSQQNRGLVANDISVGKANNKSVSVRRTSGSDNLSPVKDDKESMLLKPIRTLFHLLESNVETVRNLSIGRNDEQKPELAGLLIDQQIMEQNKQKFILSKLDKAKGRWSIGAQLAPAYSVNRSSQSSQYASNMVKSSSSPVALDGGISFSYKKGKRLSLQSGVYYSGVGQSSGKRPRYSGNDYQYSLDASNSTTPINIANRKVMMNSEVGVIQFNDVPFGIILNSSFDRNDLATAAVSSNIRLTQSFDYIEVPLYLRYTLIDSKFDIEMLGGLSTNMLVGNKVFAENNSGKSLVGKTQDMESMNYSGTLGFGVRYGISKRISLNVEPRIKYYLNSLSTNASVSYKPYTIGVFTGLSYDF